MINKCDLPQKLDKDALPGYFAAVVPLSAKTGAGLEQLAETMRRLYPQPETPSGEILTNSRQAEAVGRALASLRELLAAMREGVTPDAVLTEAEAALSALGELNGRSVSDDVTERIFSRFCVGK